MWKIVLLRGLRSHTPIVNKTPPPRSSHPRDDRPSHSNLSKNRHGHHMDTTRMPQNPADLVNALQDSVHREVGESRPAKTARSQRSRTTCPACGSDRCHSHSTTKAGSPRFRCTACKKVFTISDRSRGKPRSHEPLSNAERQRRFKQRKKLANECKESND